MARSKSTRVRKATKAVKKASKARTPPCPEYPEWSTARYFSFLRSALRQAWSKWPPKYQVLANARRVSESDNKRLKWEFQCACCGGWFAQKDVSVDHIIPAGTLRTLDDLPLFVSKLFVGVDKLQVLCTRVCHQAKTNLEKQNNKELL